MKLDKAIKKLGATEAILIAKDISIEEGINWEKGACYVFSVLTNDLERVPGNIGGKKDNENSVIRKWLKKYKGGYDSRASQRLSNPPGTIPDPIIDKIIGSRLTKLTQDDLQKISYAHRLGMSAENILGLILEEYLAENLKAHGWHCAWGETVKSVDFVHKNGGLLQIKNRSNSENSSSSSIRKGTEINKWYRIKADKIEYMWDKLNIICRTSHLSEESFIKFVQNTITSNPDCLAVETNNPWQK